MSMVQGRRAPLVVTLTVLLVAVAGLAVVSADRAAARPIEENFSITVAGTFGDQLFTPASSWISVNQSNQVEQQVLQVSVMGFDGTPLMSFDFGSRAGSGRNLAVGYYGNAQRYPFMDPGRPGISISPLGFCHDQTGNFEVRDIRFDGAAITRIWITYQRYCNLVQPADIQPAFGEIRLGYPVTAYDTSPRVIRWPAGTQVGRASSDVPVRLRRTSAGAVEVTSVSVTGRHAGDFPVRHSGCAGALSSAGCTVRVGFAPRGPGPRHANLRVVTTAGNSNISLDGAGAPGRTDWLVDVDHEDPSRADEHLELPYSFSWGLPYELGSQAYAADGILWDAFFDLAGNDTFAEGRYAYNSDGTGLQMRLSRGNDGCELDRASVDIADLAFTGPDQRLALLDLAMEVHCRASYGHTVRGRIRFQDRDDQTAPARVTGVSAVRDGGQVTLRWTNPVAADLAGVIVRWYPGSIAPGAPDVGTAAYFRTGNTISFTAPRTSPIAVSIWTYDQTGNLGSRYGLRVAP
ncbi:MAG TPA: hypothetical protein VFX88_06960 [Actinomycetota bacterium]|jgi:hypothetical protein|nr:hypothetical protein [Actinomycetota bacterium]